MGTQSPPRRALISRIFSPVFLAAVLMIGTIVTAAAQGLLRDAEIEQTLSRISEPLFKAAGLGAGNIEVLVVNDKSLNAFVANNHAIFLNYGLITRLNTIEMIQSVIGHEIAHITSGHLVRRSLNQQNANSAMGIGLLLGLTVSATGNSELAGGIAVGAAGTAVNNYLAHTRSEEVAADQVGMRYLVRAGVDPKAAIEVLEIFRGQEVLSVGRQDPYARTHPLSADRIRALKGHVAAYGGKEIKSSADLRYWHSRMIAKFKAFTGNPSYILRKLKKNDKSEAAIMTRAIAYHRLGKVDKAIDFMNQLLSKRPNDAFYHELKGQILLEGRKAGSAIKSYRKAVTLAPKEALILAGYGRALLGLKVKSGDKQALQVLRKARRMDPRDARMLRDLAVAWAKTGNNGMASLVTAERYALLGRFKDANTNAKRAEGLLPRGSQGWLRAQDIIGATKSATK